MHARNSIVTIVVKSLTPLEGEDQGRVIYFKNHIVTYYYLTNCGF